MLLRTEASSWAADAPIPGVLAGLVLLVVGAELLVRGAVWIALAIGMSRMAVGLTLVAIGTSLPELLVSLTAARTGRDAIAMANVLGSNVANVLLIVGTAAAIRAVHLRVRWFELGYMLLLSALAVVPFFVGAFVERWLAAAMVAVLALFLAQLLARERASRHLMRDEPRHVATPAGWALHAAWLAAGFAMLAYGAEWLVDGAAAIALSIGMSEAVVGMTVVAVGTSLPELATSLVAALRGQPEICVGNVVGSNIFNVGAVLGVAGLLQPFPVDTEGRWRLMWVAVGSAALMVAGLRTARGVPRLAGFAFLAAYAAFMAYEVANSGAL